MKEAIVWCRARAPPRWRRGELAPGRLHPVATANDGRSHKARAGPRRARAAGREQDSLDGDPALVEAVAGLPKTRRREGQSGHERFARQTLRRALSHCWSSRMTMMGPHDGAFARHRRHRNERHSELW